MPPVNAFGPGADVAGLEQELLDKNRRLAVLNGVARAVNSSLDLNHVLEQALDTVLQLMQLRPMGGIFLLDEAGQQLHLEVHRGLAPEFLRQEHCVKVGECLCGLAAQTGELLHSADSHLDARHSRASQAVPHAHIIVPLKSHSRVQGVMFLYPPLDHRVAPGDEQLWEMIGSQIGTAIENARLYRRTDEQLQERVGELAAALQELQGQAEEIRARDEALESQNQELQAANEALVASQRALAESRGRLLALFKQFSTIYDSVNATVSVADMETHEILYLNSHGAKIFGEDSVGKPCFQRLAGQAAPCSFCTNDKLLRDGVPQPPYVWEFQNPLTGRWALCIDRAINWTDGRFVRMEVSVDISHRKAAEVELNRALTEARAIEQEKEKLLATTSHILEAVTDAVFAIEADGRVAQVNEAAARLIGRPKDEILGRGARDVFRWEDEAGRLLEEDEYAFRRAIAEHTTVVLGGLYYRRLDGSRIPVIVSSAPIANTGETGEMVVQVVRDISREREAEELKDRIISLVSHELRTPVAHIKGFASSLLETDVEWDATTQRDFITEIDREADRLSALVTDLLDMSKIESGTDFLEKDLHRPAAIVRQALAAVGNATVGHLVVNEVGEDLPEIAVDGMQIERVISNLVENAAKYSEPGDDIHVSADVVDNAVRFRVTDLGPGIPPEYRERIFERFFRVKTGRSGVPGTGLGLPICKGIVEAHGGEFWLEATSPEGSCFAFSLPLRPQ